MARVTGLQPRQVAARPSSDVVAQHFGPAVTNNLSLASFKRAVAKMSREGVDLNNPALVRAFAKSVKPLMTKGKQDAIGDFLVKQGMSRENTFSLMLKSPAPRGPAFSTFVPPGTTVNQYVYVERHFGANVTNGLTLGSFKKAVDEMAKQKVPLNDPKLMAAFLEKARPLIAGEGPKAQQDLGAALVKCGMAEHNAERLVPGYERPASPPPADRFALQKKYFGAELTGALDRLVAGGNPEGAVLLFHQAAIGMARLGVDLNDFVLASTFARKMKPILANVTPEFQGRLLDGLSELGLSSENVAHIGFKHPAPPSAFRVNPDGSMSAVR